MQLKALIALAVCAIPLIVGCSSDDGGSGGSGGSSQDGGGAGGSGGAGASGGSSSGGAAGNGAGGSAGAGECPPCAANQVCIQRCDGLGNNMGEPQCVNPTIDGGLQCSGFECPNKPPDAQSCAGA